MKELETICVAKEYIGKQIWDGNRLRDRDIRTEYAIIRIKHGYISNIGDRAAIEYTDGSGHIENWNNGFPESIENIYTNYKEFFREGKLVHIEGKQEVHLETVSA